MRPGGSTSRSTSACSAVAERSDGPAPVWKKVYTADFPADVNMRGNGGLRGMTAISP
jgi:hypothetical protein